MIERVYDVERLENENKPHRVGDIDQTAPTCCLLANHANIDERPQDQAGP